MDPPRGPCAHENMPVVIHQHAQRLLVPALRQFGPLPLRRDLEEEAPVSCADHEIPPRGYGHREQQMLRRRPEPVHRAGGLDAIYHALSRRLRSRGLPLWGFGSRGLTRRSRNCACVEHSVASHRERMDLPLRRVVQHAGGALPIDSVHDSAPLRTGIQVSLRVGDQTHHMGIGSPVYLLRVSLRRNSQDLPLDPRARVQIPIGAERERPDVGLSGHAK